MEALEDDSSDGGVDGATMDEDGGWMRRKQPSMLIRNMWIWWTMMKKQEKLDELGQMGLKRGRIKTVSMERYLRPKRT